ncbi:MAG: hypothetical protein JO257_22790 [Deltaproteobacteria bacterium]|nr:hypothetical protein [Deltaproteobacteria bacterium]
MFDQVVAGRAAGVRILSLQVRRTAPAATDEELATLGIGELTRGRLYSVPIGGRPEATYFSARKARVRRKRGAETAMDDWTLEWEAMPNTDVPEHILRRNVPDLEDKLRQLWSSRPESQATSVHLSYLMTGWTSPLVVAAEERFGSITATPLGTFWRVNGTDLVRMFSPLRAKEHEMLVTIIAETEAAGWPDVTSLEQRIWNDVLPFLVPRDEAK